MAFLTLEGELNWTRVVNPEEYEGKKSWSTTITLDPEGVNTVMELKAEGVKNSLKKNAETGKWYVKFSRPVEIKKGDKVTRVLSPPIVTDKDGNILDGLTIGNGSKGIITLDVYEHPVKGGAKAKAARLEKIMITELIKYGS
jgi:hypothetical protein